MKLPETTGSDFEAAEPGLDLGICYSILDLGTIQTEYEGKPRLRRIVRIHFELPNQLTDEGQPKTISKRYTFSSSDKSAIVKDIYAWTGQRVGAGFDMSELLEKPAMLTIVKEERDGKTYVNISGIAPLMRGMTPPSRTNPLHMLSLEPGEFIQGVFDAQSDGTKDQIAVTPEFAELVAKGVAQPYTPKRQPQGKPAATSQPVNGGAYGPAGMGHATQEIPVSAYGN